MNAKSLDTWTISKLESTKYTSVKTIRTVQAFYIYTAENDHRLIG